MCCWKRMCVFATCIIVLVLCTNGFLLSTGDTTAPSGFVGGQVLYVNEDNEAVAPVSGVDVEIVYGEDSITLQTSSDGSFETMLQDYQGEVTAELVVHGTFFEKTLVLSTESPFIIFEFNISCSIDEIVITDSPDGTPIENPVLSVGGQIEVYASTYNNTIGYLGLVRAEWSGEGGHWYPVFGRTSTYTASINPGKYTQTLEYDDIRIEMDIDILEPTMDRIWIQDSPGASGNIMEDHLLLVDDNITGYAAAHNNTSGYVMDVYVFWTVENTNGSEAYTSVAEGENSTFHAGVKSGNATWTAGYVVDAEWYNHSIELEITDYSVDRIQIEDAVGVLHYNKTLGVGATVAGYAAAYNSTRGFLGNISAAWSVENSHGAGAFVQTSHGPESVFAAGNHGGKALWTADYRGLTYTVEFNILPPEIDYISIVTNHDTGNRTIYRKRVDVGASITGYSAGFNDTSGYVRNVEALWSVNGEGRTAPLVTYPASGNSIKGTVDVGIIGGKAYWSATAIVFERTLQATTEIIIREPAIDNIILTNTNNEEWPDRRVTLQEGTITNIKALGSNNTAGILGPARGVIWAVDNDTLAIINQSNPTTLEALKPGSTTITASWSDMDETLDLVIESAPSEDAGEDEEDSKEKTFFQERGWIMAISAAVLALALILLYQKRKPGGKVLWEPESEEGLDSTNGASNMDEANGLGERPQVFKQVYRSS